MNKLLLHLIFLVVFVRVSSMFSQSNPSFSGKSAGGFIENKVQITDQNLKPNPDVKYLFNSPGMNIQLKANSFSYDTYTIEQKEKPAKETPLKKINLPETENVYHFHRVDVEFIGANKNPEMISEGATGTYLNYYTSGTNEKGVSNVKNFSKVTYKNLYPNIDLEFIVKEGSVKYNFVLNYGSDINNIRWKYNGADDADFNNGNIQIRVAQGFFTETIPESYLSSSAGKIKNVNVYFDCDHDIYGFSTKEKIIVKQNEQLIIDPLPNVIWATYFGGSLAENFISTCIDVNGNVFITGNSRSLSSIATAGAHQTVHGGGISDAVILKFNSLGLLKWATYFGGNSNDCGTEIVIDKFSNLFIAGVTTSTASISTPSVHQINYGGGSDDGFLAKFDTNGVRIWATYYGGALYDDAYGCAVDTVGNVYMVGSTTSTNSISTPGAYQVSYGGGPWDAYVAKFNNNGVRQWATYYGNVGDDGGSCPCTTDPAGNLYFGGYSKSSSGISSPGAHQSGYGGNYDAFLAKFDKNGARKWCSYYGGSGLDVTFFPYYNNGFVYITGRTSSVDSISTVGAYKVNYSGSDDVFLVKFDTLGVRQWATYYGGYGYDFGLSITSDVSNLYICGQTISSTSISSVNAYQVNSTGSSDMFLSKFSKSGVFQWGTYLGGPGYDMASCVQMDPFGDLYIVGMADSYSLSVAAIHQPLLGGGFDGFCAKFNQPINTEVKQENIENTFLNVFPNPNNGSFIIESKIDVELCILNALGQTLKTITLNNSNQNQAIISDLPSGIYFVSDKSNKSLSKKVVVIK